MRIHSRYYVTLLHSSSHNHTQWMRSHGISLRHAVLCVKPMEQPNKHILQSNCSHRIIRDRTDAEFCATSRTNTSILYIEIGNLRQELLNLLLITFPLFYSVTDITEVSFLRLHVLRANVVPSTHGILIIVQFSLAVGLQNIRRRVSVSITPNSEPLVC